jgi:hypothetical protein
MLYQELNGVTVMKNLREVSSTTTLPLHADAQVPKHGVRMQKDAFAQEKEVVPLSGMPQHRDASVNLNSEEKSGILTMKNVPAQLVHKWIP